MKLTVPASRAECETFDAKDPLRHLRERFVLPAQGGVYLDGNSLGAMPAAVPARLAETLETAWGRDLITSWNRHGWIDLPRRAGDAIAPLLGAAPGQVLACDSISVNLFKLLAAALSLRPGRNRIVSTRDNFPTDLYVGQGLAAFLGEARCELVLVDRDELTDAVDATTAVVFASHVDFRSGACFDMAEVTAAVHDQGALMLWDLAHSAGAMPLALDALGGRGADVGV